MDLIWFMHRLVKILQIFSNYSNYCLWYKIQCWMSLQEIRHQTIKLAIFPHLIQVSTEAFELGCNISSDKKYENFQWNHEDKQWVTFKNTGDGFLIDSVCDYGYTINFYLRNPPPPKRLIWKGYSPTNSQIIFHVRFLAWSILNLRHGQHFHFRKVLAGSVHKNKV